MVSALDRKLLRDVWRLRGQLLAVVLVVMCGVATFLTMRGMYETLLAERGDYYARYRFADVFAQAKRAPERLRQSIAGIPGVTAVETGISLEVTLDVPRLEEPATGLLVSVPDRGRPALNDLHLRSGRYIEPGAADEVILSDAFARANRLTPGDTLSAVINGRWQRLHVVGVAISPEFIYVLRPASGLPDDRRYGVLWMGRKALAHAYDMDGAFNRVMVSLARNGSEAEVIARLDRLLERYGALGAYGRGEHLSAKIIADEIAQDRIYGTVISGIFLGVAAFILHIVLTRLIAIERDRIGTLKAFGYRRGEIAGHYLKLALVPAALGVTLGLPLAAWLGAGLADIYREFFHFPELRWSISPFGLLLALGIALAAALAGAFSAVQRAVHLAPAEAMQPEPPPRFRPGAVERAGLQRWLSLGQRMILRNLERRPWRAALAVLGLALAVAILVVGRYGMDAMDHIIDVEFRAAQRGDVTLDFANPLSAGARYALPHLPGVLAAEPYRYVPVRLRHQHRERRTAILGLPADGDLRHIVDLDYRRFAPPADGLLLSAKLADSLGVKPGDDLTVEVLEGRRTVRSLPVTGVVDDLVGVGAYMALDSLNRLTFDPPGTLSGAILAVDGSSRDTLYRELKRLPQVKSVAVKEAMLAGFRDVIARSLTVQTAINIVFACVIAFGVVYNSVRIALSERAHELASLRVLGFTEQEIAVLLLGEQALVTLAAIPVGLALGAGICALIVWALNAQETFRLPLVFTARTFAFACVVVVVAAAASSLLILRRLRRLDLVAVLKTRE